MMVGMLITPIDLTVEYITIKLVKNIASGWPNLTMVLTDDIFILESVAL
jgi:hypothetical protein